MMPNLDAIKEGLKKFMPLIKVAAKLTPNKVDDLAVEFLEKLISDDTALAQAVASTNPQ